MIASEKSVKAFTARFPEVLYITMQNEVARRKASGEPKISVQDWLLEAVREKLYPESGPGQRNPVENSGTVILPHGKMGPKLTAAELAIKFGIKTGATIEEVEPGLLGPEFANPGLTSEPERKPKRDWAKFYREMAEMEPSEAEYEFRNATESIKLPTGFRKMPANRQVAWLTEFA